MKRGRATCRYSGFVAIQDLHAGDCLYRPLNGERFAAPIMTEIPQSNMPSSVTKAPKSIKGRLLGIEHCQLWGLKDSPRRGNPANLSQEWFWCDKEWNLMRLGTSHGKATAVSAESNQVSKPEFKGKKPPNAWTVWRDLGGSGRSHGEV